MPATKRWTSAARILAVSGLLAPARAQVTQRINIGVGNAEANGLSFTSYRGISGGRYVPFFSDANNLVPGDTNGARDAFLRDRRTGTTERVSVDSEGVQANARSEDVWCSPDGRYVSFSSPASNLVPQDTNGVRDVFVRDRERGATERVSVASNGSPGDGVSYRGQITPDGRYVVFLSGATNLVPGDTNGEEDVFLHDRRTRTTERVSVGSFGSQGNGGSYNGFVSDDGRFVSFDSTSSNLVSGDTNGDRDVFVRDRATGITERVSVSTGGVQGNGESYAGPITPDGRLVAIVSEAANLVPGDTNSYGDIFVRDRVLHTTERVSVDSAGGQSRGSSSGPSISDDGRYVAFGSVGVLVPGAHQGQCYVRDRLAGATELVSMNWSGASGNSTFIDVQASISPDGRFVMFDSWANNLVPGDSNGVSDVFVRDRFGGTSFTSVCDPGADGVIACPCGNAPSGAGRGCDNSSSTGGAILAASGGAFLSSDSLAFATSGEKATALSILLQGDESNPGGRVYGQGVHCLGGTIVRRLFLGRASGGSITLPDLDAGEPTVSARSAAKGDLIRPGERRFYVVCYRDPIVLGGCPPASTLNATQTGRIDWNP